MFDFVPDASRLAEIFSNAIAPTFFLGAIAAFVFAHGFETGNRHGAYSDTERDSG